MRTRISRSENDKDKKKRLSKKANDGSYVRRMVGSLDKEQIQCMLETNRNTIFKKTQDPTARAIFNSIQMKMNISQSQDQAEIQADKVAEGVTKGNTNLSKSALEQSTSDIHTKSEGGAMTTTSEFDQQLQGTKGQGQKLGNDVRTEMEGHLNTDLSGVNIHTSGDAKNMSEGINAKAFTHGQDVYFNEGKYNPSSNEGKSLLAHELTHTVQQSDKTVQPKIQRQTDKSKLKTLRSSIFSGPGREQLLNTLNKDPKKGDLIGEGATGNYVILIQKAINYLYKDKKDFIPLKLQKDYGPKTKAGVSLFQKDYQLTAGTNGVVGPETIECLDTEVALKEETESFKSSLELNDIYSLLNNDNRGNPLALVNEKVKSSKNDKKDEDTFGVGFEGAGVAPVQDYFYKEGSTKVTPEVALNILDNVSKGEPPFKPELGKGGASWFTIEGNPYVGKKAMNKSIRINAEIFKSPNRLIFKEADLVKMHNEEIAILKPTAESKYRTFNNIPPNKALTLTQQEGLQFFIKSRAEDTMWTKIGQKVKNSKAQSGEIIYEPGSKFSSIPGKVAVISDPSLISIKGGVKGILDQLLEQGLGKEPVLIETGEKLAKKMKWAGEVRGAFRYAGRILLVMGIATDVYKVYRAKDKVKAVVESAGGWAGASAGASAFAELWTPLDAAGPIAWLLHGVGTLISGAVGYWVGSSTTRMVYEVTVEPEPKKEKTVSSDFGGYGGGGFGGGGSGGGGSGGGGSGGGW